MDVKAQIYPPFFEDMDEKESIEDKWDVCIHILENIIYMITSHRKKIWYMQEHTTLIEARKLFSAVYNPIKCFFDMYVTTHEMPNSYIKCKFTMKYREYMQWEITHFTCNLEVACRDLIGFVKVVYDTSNWITSQE